MTPMQQRISSTKFAALVANVLLVFAAAQLLPYVTAAPLEIDDDSDSADSEWSSTAVQRIRTPCVGGQSIAQQIPLQQRQQLPLEQAEGEVSDSIVGETYGRQRIAQILQATNGMLERLRHRVAELKMTYANRRHAVFIGLHVDGMPQSTQVNMQLNMSDAVSATVDQLSRVAVLLDLVAIEESQYEPNPFTEVIRQLQDHSQRGIYNILCTLHGLWATVSNRQQRASTETRLELEASQLSLPSTSQRSHRHLRVYSILHDLEQLLPRLTVRFNSFIAAAIR